MLAVIFMVVIVSALTTELIGIHALFGAFLAGIVMPTAAGFRDKLVVRVENLSAVLLLPVFFAFTGLRTQIGLLNRCSGLADLLDHHRSSHCGETRWKRRGGPAYRDELARVASTGRADEHAGTDGTHRA